MTYFSTLKIFLKSNISYFLSDGVPTESDGDNTQLLNQAGGTDDGIQPAEQLIWENFLTTNGIDSYAVGFGGADVSVNGPLAPISYSGTTGAQTAPVDGTTDLNAALEDTLPPAVNGDLLSGNITENGFGIGADGGYVGQVIVSGTVFNFDGTNLTVTGSAIYEFDATGNVLTIDTAKGSQLVVDMDDGN